MRRMRADHSVVTARLGTVLGAFVSCALLVLPSDGFAQAEALSVVGPGARRMEIPVFRERAYATFGEAELERLGWEVQSGPDGFEAIFLGGAVLSVHIGSPFFRWNDELLQFVDRPFASGGRIHVPLQLILDFLPIRLPETYALGDDGLTLRVLNPEAWERSNEAVPDAEAGSETPGDGVRAASETPTVTAATEEPITLSKRVVVIDAGHGGKDPGTRGSAGTREKDVALAIALALAAELNGDPAFEVHLTRDDDTFIPLWERGAMATEWKGDRAGVFISIHGNAVPGRPEVRGFEIYFLSQARTEHERRVAALENAPLRLEGESLFEGENPDLTFILRDLQNSDHQHWSSQLAEFAEDRIADVHPGPNRGVRQGPLAVITNALMPAILVEAGYLTNPAEERTLKDATFQRDTARALAGAVRDFFGRYPPGSTLPASPGSR